MRIKTEEDGKYFRWKSQLFPPFYAGNGAKCLKKLEKEKRKVQVEPVTDSQSG